MINLSQMSIDALEEFLSKVTDPTSASSAESVLQSKSIRFLSSEIEIFRKLCVWNQRKCRNQTRN